MAFGLNVGSGAGGDFLGIVKYDARSGRAFRVDRESGSSNPVDITRTFKAVFDFQNMEVGYIRFGAGLAPDFQLVPLGAALPPKPSDDHRQGVRLVIKLHKDCGGDIRELSGTSAAMIGGLEEAHNEYVDKAAAHAGKLPVIVLRETMPIESGKGQNKSTNYRPSFEIVGWVDRPADLVPNMRGMTAPVAAANGAPFASRATPPSTGSTRVAAPVAVAVSTTAGDDDFG